MKTLNPIQRIKAKVAILKRLGFRKSLPALTATRRAMETGSIKDHTIAERKNWDVSRLLRDFDWRYYGFRDTSTAAKRLAFEKKCRIHSLHQSLGFYHGNMRAYLNGLVERKKVLQRRASWQKMMEVK